MGKDKDKGEKSDKEDKRDSLNAQLRMSGQRGNLSLMKEVLQEKKLVDINNQDGLGNTALHYAAQACHMNVLAHLLENEADPNVQNALGETALHRACHKNFIDGAEALLKAGADPNILTKDKKKPHHVTTNPTVKKLLDKAEKTTTKAEEIDMSMIADAADRDD